MSSARSDREHAREQLLVAVAGQGTLTTGELRSFFAKTFFNHERDPATAGPVDAALNISRVSARSLGSSRVSARSLGSSAGSTTHISDTRARLEAASRLALVLHQLYVRMIVSNDVDMELAAEGVSEFFRDVQGVVRLAELLERGTGITFVTKHYVELSVILERDMTTWDDGDRATVMRHFTTIFNDMIGASPVAVGAHELTSKVLVERLARTDPQRLERMGIRYEPNQGYVIVPGYILRQPGSRQHVNIDYAILRATDMGDGSSTWSVVGIIEPTLATMASYALYQPNKDLGPYGRIAWMAAILMHSRITLFHPVTYGGFFQANGDALLVGTDELPGYLRIGTMGTLVYHDSSGTLARLDLATYTGKDAAGRAAVLAALDASVDNGGPVQLLTRYQSPLSRATRNAYIAFHEAVNPGDPASSPDSHWFNGHLIEQPAGGWPTSLQGTVNLIVSTLRHDDGRSMIGVHGAGEFTSSPDSLVDTWHQWEDSTLETLPASGISQDMVDQFVNHQWSILVEGDQLYLVRNRVFTMAAAETIAGDLAALWRTTSDTVVGHAITRDVAGRLQRFLETATRIHAMRVNAADQLKFVTRDLVPALGTNEGMVGRMKNVLHALGVARSDVQVSHRFTKNSVTAVVSFTTAGIPFTVLVTTTSAGVTTYAVQLVDGVDITVDKGGEITFTPLTGRDLPIAELGRWLHQTIVQASSTHATLVQQSHLAHALQHVIMINTADMFRGIPGESMDTRFDRATHAMTVDHVIAGHSFVYTIDTTTMQGTLAIDGQPVSQSFDASPARAGTRWGGEGLPGWTAFMQRWVTPLINVVAAVERNAPGAALVATPGAGGVDVVITPDPQGHPGHVVRAMLPTDIVAQQAFPVLLENAAGRVLQLGTYGIYDTRSAATMVVLIAEAGAGGFTPGPVAPGATTFTWCGLDIVAGTRPSFAIVLHDHAASVDVTFDVELGALQGGSARPAHVVERSTGFTLAESTSLAFAVTRVRNMLSAVADVAFIRMATAIPGTMPVHVLPGSIARGTVDHSAQQQGGSRTAITTFVARIHNQASGQHVDVPLMIVHAQATGHVQDVRVHAPFSFSPGTSLSTIPHFVANPASLARTIDGVLDRFTVTGTRLDQMREKTGWLVLEAVAHPLRGGSMDIVLVPTGGTHPVFTGAVAIRNVNLPYGMPGYHSIFAAESVRGGGDDLSWPNPAGKNPKTLKEHRGIWSDGVQGLAHVQGVLYTLAERAYQIVQIPFQDTWGTVGWRLLAATSFYSTFGNQPLAPHGSVLLRLQFQHHQDGPCVTIHVVVKPDGSMMVNWRWDVKVHNEVGPVLFDPVDKTVVLLPQWWDPAVIRNQDGSLRYNPADPSGMFLAFLNDVPFDTPRWVP